MGICVFWCVSLVGREHTQRLKPGLLLGGRGPRLKPWRTFRQRHSYKRRQSLPAGCDPAQGLAVAGERAYAEAMAHLRESPLMDWSDCPLVEVVPGKVSGVPLLKGTRLPADTVLSNFEAGSPVEEISDNFDMPEESIRDLLNYATKKQNELHR